MCPGLWLSSGAGRGPDLTCTAFYSFGKGFYKRPAVEHPLGRRIKGSALPSQGWAVS